MLIFRVKTHFLGHTGHICSVTCGSGSSQLCLLQGGSLASGQSLAAALGVSPPAAAPRTPPTPRPLPDSRFIIPVPRTHSRSTGRAQAGGTGAEPAPQCPGRVRGHQLPRSLGGHIWDPGGRAVDQQWHAPVGPCGRSTSGPALAPRTQTGRHLAPRGLFVPRGAVLRRAWGTSSDNQQLSRGFTCRASRRLGVTCDCVRRPIPIPPAHGEPRARYPGQDRVLPIPASPRRFARSGALAVPRSGHTPGSDH